MKRSEMLIKIARYYGIRHCMVESNYITPLEFCQEMLELIEDLGMVPPIQEENSFQMLDTGEMTYAVHEWEEE